VIIGGERRKKETEVSARLRLASERSEAEIAAERQRQDAEGAAEALNDAARNLAANLLRVIAGAGKKHAVIDEAIALLKACRELQPYSGTDAYPYSPIAAIAEGLTDLDWRKNDPAYPDYSSEEDRRRWLEDGTEDVRLAEEEAVRAVLRLVAARLVRQPTQESVSRKQFIRALLDFERARTKHHRHYTSGRPSRKR
jgi:hypothetical protein